MQDGLDYIAKAIIARMAMGAITAVGADVCVSQCHQLLSDPFECPPRCP